MNEDITFQFWLAKWFGEPISQTDGDYTVTGFSWRGHLFVTGVTKALQPPALPTSP